MEGDIKGEFLWEDRSPGLGWAGREGKEKMG